MEVYRCRHCKALIVDPTKHICHGFEKLDIPAKDVCRANGHQFNLSTWTEYSSDGVQVDRWENDPGHFEPNTFKEMETKTCSVCGHAETRCIRTYPNPRL